MDKQISDAEISRLLLNNLESLQLDDTSELVVVGNFNPPDVSWTSGRVLAPCGTCDKSLVSQQEFLDVIFQCGIAVDHVARRRVVNGELQESILDQVFTSNIDLVECIKISAPLGHSDHAITNADLKTSHVARETCLVQM